MSTIYTPSPAPVTTITIPDDSDVGSSTVNVPLEALADGVANAQVNIATLIDLMLATPPGLRLTLVSGDPVPSGDHSGSTVYYTPFSHDVIALYSGTGWVAHKTAEISLSIATLTSAADEIFDIFAYWNGSAVVLEGSAAWASHSARTDALARQDGILVKAANHTRRYVGSVYTSATFGTVFDGSTTTRNVRGLWNQYNRVPRSVVADEATATASWAYNSASWRPANGDAGNCVTVLIGDTAQLDVEVNAYAQVTGSTPYSALVGIGINSTTATSADSYGGALCDATISPLRATYSHPAAAGLYVATWLESGNPTNPPGFFGTNTVGSPVQSSIVAKVVM